MSSWQTSLPSELDDAIYWVWGPEMKVYSYGSVEHPLMAYYANDFGVIGWYSIDHFDSGHDPLPIQGVTHSILIEVPEPPEGNTHG